MTDDRSAQPEGVWACPFIAFEGDQDHRADRPDYRHRCYAVGHPEPRALPHQERYCLSAAFAECPMFLDWARQEAAAALPAAPGAARGPGRAPVEAPGFLAGRTRSAAPGPTPPPAPRTAELAAGVWQPEVERREDSRSRTAVASARAITLDTTPGATAEPDKPIWAKVRHIERYPRLRPLGYQRGTPPLLLTTMVLAIIFVMLLLYPILTSQKGSQAYTPLPSLSAEPTEEATPTPEASPTYLIHVVQKGEFLQSIAQRYGVTWQEIAALNNISDPSKIYPGQKLKIPPRSAASPTPTESPSPVLTPTPSATVP
jgi:LysM repeat protein